MYTPEGRNGGKSAKHFGYRKARSAVRAANGTEGTSSRTPCTGAFNELQQTHGVREQGRKRCHQYQTICGAENGTR